MPAKKSKPAKKGTPANAERLCDLECQGKRPPPGAPLEANEFIGPVKIVLLDSTVADYKRKAWGSAVFTLAMLLLGTTVFTVFFFTLKFQLPFNMNVHVLLCTMGFQLFMTTGIMMFSSLFGASMHLKPADKRFQHFFLEAFGVLFGVAGTVFALGHMSNTLHSYTGFVAAALSIVSCLVGPSEYVTDPEKFFGFFNRKYHRNITVPTFILSTVSFVLGLMKESFIKWAPVKHLEYILICFTILYSGTAVMAVVLRHKFKC